MILPDELSQAAVRVRAQVIGGFPWWLRAVTSRDVVAITLARRIYVRSKATTDVLSRLLRHEFTHVEQIERHGLLGFYWRYCAEYVRNRRCGMPASAAYRNIPFEMEAYAAEEKE